MGSLSAASAERRSTRKQSRLGFRVPAAESPPLKFNSRWEGYPMPVECKDASTLVMMRDRTVGGSPELLMVRRSQRAGFAPGAFVFPGGVLEEADYSAHALALSPGLAPRAAGSVLEDVESPAKALGFLIAAIRETFEEVGILLANRGEDGLWQPSAAEGEELESVRRQVGGRSTVFFQWVSSAGLHLATERLVYFAHWITPESRPKRFDTRFFLAAVPGSVSAKPDFHEITEAHWFLPREAMELHERKHLPILNPTLRNLEFLARFSSTAQAVEELTKREVSAVLPRIMTNPDKSETIFHPWDTNYETH